MKVSVIYTYIYQYQEFTSLFKYFFYVDHFFFKETFTEFITILLLFYVLVFWP